MRITTILLSMLVTALSSAVVLGQQKPSGAYAQVNGLRMYYEIRGQGEPLVLLHGAFMAIEGEWSDLANELAKTHKVIAVEMQGHGRTGDIKRDMSYENLSDDVAALLDHLKVPRADVVGYSLGGSVVILTAIRHPDIVRKVVSISASMRSGTWTIDANAFWRGFTSEMMKGTPAEIGYKKLNPNPDGFAEFFDHLKATAMRPYDFGADKLKATKAPMFFIHGDADGIKLEHIAEMYRLKGGDVHGDTGPRPESRLAIVPNTTHVTLIDQVSTLVPMINDFLDAKPQK